MEIITRVVVGLVLSLILLILFIATIVRECSADPGDCWLGDCVIICDGETCKQECKEFCRDD